MKVKHTPGQPSPSPGPAAWHPLPAAEVLERMGSARSHWLLDGWSVAAQGTDILVKHAWHLAPHA